jgi:hypothetical protein
MNVIADPAMALAELRRRGLPDVFGRIWSTGRVGTLGHIGHAPDRYFRLAADLTARVPGASGLCPLWEQNGEAVVGLLPSGDYVRIYYEDVGLGDAAIERFAGNYREFVAAVLEELAEAGLEELSGQIRTALGDSAEPSN